MSNSEMAGSEINKGLLADQILEDEALKEALGDISQADLKDQTGIGQTFKEVILAARDHGKKSAEYYEAVDKLDAQLDQREKSGEVVRIDRDTFRNPGNIRTRLHGDGQMYFPDEWWNKLMAGDIGSLYADMVNRYLDEKKAGNTTKNEWVPIYIEKSGAVMPTLYLVRADSPEAQQIVPVLRWYHKYLPSVDKAADAEVVH